MKPKAVFVLGYVTARSAEAGQAISDDDLALLDETSERAGVDVQVVLAVQDKATWGRKPSMAQLRAERPRLLAEIEAAKADGALFVVAFGPVAVAALWAKGGLKAKELKYAAHRLPDVALPVHVTNSLEEVYVKPGLATWLGLDVLRALAGEVPSKLGTYYVEQEMRPELREYLAAGKYRTITFDLETYPGLDPYAPDARIRMVIISHVSGWAQVVQCGPASEVPQWVQDLTANPDVIKTGSHVRYDVMWWRRFGYTIKNFFCTQHMEHLLDENSGVTDMKTLTFRYHATLGDYSAGQRKLVTERTIRDKKGKEIESGWRHVKDEEMYDYAGGDGDAGITIFKGQVDRCEAAGLWRPYKIMKETFPAITQLELAGACVDMAENAALEERYTAEISRLKSEIRGALGAALNPRSVPQLVAALQSVVPDVDLRKAFSREEDEYSTAAQVLRREAKKHPVIGLVLEYRRRDALKKFVAGVRKYATLVNGQHFVFSSLRGDITTTYRLSSSHPNLQNLPRKAEEAEARSGFVSSFKGDPMLLNVKSQYISRFEGGSIQEWDQSQLELRETGMIANDAALIAAFASGEDVHTTLAAMMLGMQPAEITKDQRQNCKETNFHVLYGGRAFGLSLRLGCPQWRAQQMIDQFDATFVDFRRWERERHQEMKDRGYVESRFGFRRRCRAPREWNTREGRHILRQAGNAPIQGGASTIVNLGIVHVLHLFKMAGLRSVPFLTVHDSILIDVYPGEEQRVSELVRIGMEDPLLGKYDVALTIPLRVDGKAGPNWAAMKEVA